MAFVMETRERVKHMRGNFLFMVYFLLRFFY